MDFFEQQDASRRRTWILVLYLVAAVAAIVAAVNVAAYAIAVFGGAVSHDPAAWLAQPWWMVISLVAIGVIAAGSLVRLVRLRGGGRAVAEMVGARALAPDTRDTAERRLRNVAEEMAIASGTPVPELYVLEAETGINAFVAGYEPTQAVMVVTRGALDSLDRDELQGVVGHELSHVLNGDMRLNVRLMSLLAGILALAVIGKLMLRSGAYGGYRRSSSRSRGRSGGVAWLLAAGLALVVVGYAGQLFGRLIKSAVSRQREYLADASSVQFTRNPRGLASALHRIGEAARGSRLDHPRAEEIAHMCFGQAAALSRLFATHPPLDDRIRRIDPHFEGRKAAERIRARHAGAPGASQPLAPAGIAGLAALAPAVAGSDAVRTDVAHMVASVGLPDERHVRVAERMHDRLPERLLEAAHNPRAAAWVCYAVLLTESYESAGQVLPAGADEHLRRAEGAACADATARLVAGLAPLGPAVRLPVVDLALPALRRLSAVHRSRVVKTARALAVADRRMSLFEFVLVRLLDAQIGARPSRRQRVLGSFETVWSDVALLLALVCASGAGNEAAAAASFESAARHFERGKLVMPGAGTLKLAGVERALERLQALSPLLKRPLLEACADAVLHDGVVLDSEGELLRAIAETLDCPMPPLLAADGP